MDRLFWAFCRQHGVNGDAFTARLRAADESLRWPADRLLELQRDGLRELLEFAAAGVPYYRDLFNDIGLTPADCGAQDVLPRLPVLSKERLRAAGPRILAEGSRSGWRTAQTSGSTGPSTRTLNDRGSRLSTYVMRTRALGWYGARPWERHAMVVPQNPGRIARFRSACVDRISGRVRNGTPAMTPELARSLMPRLHRLGPAWLLGQASMLYELAHDALAAGLEPNRLGVRAVLANAEVLTPYVDTRLAEAFNAPVLNEYGCTEVGSMAHRCPRGTLHLNVEHALVELVDRDGQPVPPGEPGEVLLTSLQNRAMPLVRYAVGDVAVRDSAACPCGLQPGLAGLRSIEGRTATAWRDESGRIMPMLEWISQLQSRLAIHGFWESQFVQCAAKRIGIRTHPTGELPASLLAEASVLLAGVLGPGVVVEALREPIQRTAAGKLPVILRTPDSRAIRAGVSRGK